VSSKITTFTCPGKCGDALHQWPIAYWWHREQGETFDLWLDQKTCAPLLPLFSVQPGVRSVELVPGIESWPMGGQPWHFNLEPEQHQDRLFVHLGMRSFPNRQITLHAREQAAVQIAVSQNDLAETPNIELGEVAKARRVVIHGTAICTHNKQTPDLWRFIASIRGWLEQRFPEGIVFVGSESDRATGLRTYPGWSEFDDQGDFLTLARCLAGSELVIGCGSVVAALAGQIKVPCVRVHDDIGGAPKVIWSNLGNNQLNATELELRTEWPAYRDRFLGEDHVPAAR